jgi:hypothetical protein
MPLITRLRLPPPQLIGVGLAEFQAPLANSFVGHPDPAGDEQLLDIAVTEGETEIEPDGVRDDLGGITVALVQSRIRGCGHGPLYYERATRCLPAGELT